MENSLHQNLNNNTKQRAMAFYISSSSIFIKKMKYLLVLSLLLISHLSFSQNWVFEKPDYKTIEKNIKKKSSGFYYETLMNRYKAGDSTMSLEEKRHLYYGYTFNKNYAPYSRSGFEDSLNNLLQKEDLNAEDFQTIKMLTNLMLAKDPFDLSAINYQLFALEQTAAEDEFQIRVAQLRTVFDALMSSGNGLSKETAFYVISTAHEYDLLNILGFRFGGKQSLIEHYDYLTLAENEDGIEGFYFDVSPCLNSLSRMFK